LIPEQAVFYFKGSVQMKTKIVNDIFDYFEPPTRWERFQWSLEKLRDSIVIYLQEFKQRYKYGFPLKESWDFYHHCSKWIVPRLKELKNSKESRPFDLTLEEWHTIIEKMIWSFEHIDDYVRPTYSNDYDFRYEATEENGIATFRSLNKTGVVDWSPVEEHNKRIQDGLDLFAKHFRSLWD